MINKIKIHAEIVTGIHDLYIAKNADYGDSFSKVRNKFPNAILIRLNDKLSRLETLMTGATQQVIDESIDDTLSDLAGYCILEKVERKADLEYLELINVHAVKAGV